MKRRCYLALALFTMTASTLTMGYSSVLAEETVSTEAADAAEDTAEEKADGEAVLEDGLYTAEFHTDSSMFHVNEANEGLGILTVKDGKMTFHVSLASQSIVNLFPGTAEDAQKEGAELLEPTLDTVTYSDGLSEEVYGFNIPVLALDEEFDLALIGKKEKWYDHKVSVVNAKPATEEELEKLAATEFEEDDSQEASDTEE